MRRLLVALTLALAVLLPASWLTPVQARTAGVLEYTTTPQQTAPAGADGVSVTPSGTAFSFSSWVQVIASAGTDIGISGISVMPGVGSSSGDAVDPGIEIGIGGAGAESAIGRYAMSAQGDEGGNFYVPVYPLREVSSGSRVSVRLALNSTSTAVWKIGLTYYALPLTGLATTTTANATRFGDVNLTPGASWANGSYVQQSAALSTDIAVFAVGPDLNAQTITQIEYDLATGGAGSETVATTVRTDFENTLSCSACGGPRIVPVFPLRTLASGSRLALRARRAASGSANGYWTSTHYLPTWTGLDRITTALPQKWYPSAANSLSVSTPSSAWTSGAWVQATASTANAIAITSVVLDGEADACGSGNREYELDLGHGGAGAEVVDATLRFGYTVASTGDHRAFTVSPAVNIASGQRVAMRGRCSGATAKTEQVALGYIESPDFDQRTSLARRTYPAAADGAALTPSGTGWSNSAWVEIVSATAHPILIPAVAVATGSGGGTFDGEYEIDLGRGGAGSEAVATTIRAGIANVGGIVRVSLMPPLAVAAGTRLAARIRKTGTSTAEWRVAVEYVDDYTPPSGLLPPINPLWFCCAPHVRAAMKGLR